MINQNQQKTRQPKNKKPAAKSLASRSTKAASSLMDQGFLTQGFIVSKDKKNQAKNNNLKNSKKNNLYDLQRTLDINIEILKNYFKNTTSAMTLLNQDKQIIDKIDIFVNKYNKKKEIVKKIKDIKSKNLMQQQFFFETKRKLQETLNNCKESLLDNEDAVNNKDEYVKLFQKKFVEVEIYLQRITSDMEDERKKKYYQTYKMDVFTNLNTTLNKKKENLQEEINKYKIGKKKLKIENQKIKKDEKVNMEEEKNRDLEREKEDETIKKKNEMIEEKYKGFVKDKIKRLNALKNFMNNNCNIDKLLNRPTNININNINEIKESIITNDIEDKDKKKITMFKKVDVKKNKNSERNNNDDIKMDEDEKSILPYEMTKRMNSFMDFSTILNDNSRIKESVNTNVKKTNISRIWGDVSAIEKNDDF